MISKGRAWFMRGLFNANNILAPATGATYASVSVLYLTSSKMTASGLARGIGVGMRAMSRCDRGPALGQPQTGGVPG